MFGQVINRVGKIKDFVSNRVKFFGRGAVHYADICYTGATSNLLLVLTT